MLLRAGFTVVVLSLCLFGQAGPAVAQAATSASWVGQIQARLLRLQAQALDQAAQAERRIGAAEQVIQQSQDAMAQAQAAGNSVAVQTARDAQSRALAARSRAQHLLATARHSADRASAAIASLRRLSPTQIPGTSDALMVYQAGDVRIGRHGLATQPLNPTAAQPVQSGDTVRTAAASQARFFLADGKSLVALDEDTALTYHDGADRTTIELMTGRIRLAIEQWAKQFEVRTPIAVLGIRGTRFTVEQRNPQAPTEVRVVEGLVEIRGQPGDAPITLSAGMRLLMHADGHVQGPLALDPSSDEFLGSNF